MEEVRGLVPVDPHASKVVSQKVVERVPGQEAQTIRYPVCFVGRVVVVGFCSLAQATDSFSALLIRTRPYPEGNAVQGVRGILLQNERMMYTVGLASASTYLDIVGKACLQTISDSLMDTWRRNIPSWRRGELWQCRCLAPAVDYCPVFPATKTGRRHLSCERSSLEKGPVLSPIVMVLGPHHRPCRHG